MDVVFDNFDLYVEAFVVTAKLTFLSAALALLVGTIIAAIRVSPVAPLRGAGLVYVEILRNTPLLVVLFIFVFVLPKLGFTFSFFTCAVIGIALYHGAFVSEALRSGINSVSAGQAEAARSVGLTFGQTLTSVVLPQAFRTVVPPLGNLFIALTKNTSIASTIAVADLTALATELSARTAQPVQVLFGVALAYMVITVPAGLLFGVIERRVAIAR